MADQTMLTVIVISFMIFLFFRYCLGYETLIDRQDFQAHKDFHEDIHRMVAGE